ncbi:MAG: hypothetical protein ABI401_04900, partial [Candidatus Dormibacter sp.]
MHRLTTVLMGCLALLQVMPARAAGNLSWEQWQTVPGVFDVTGSMPDGTLLVATEKGLVGLRPNTGALFPARSDLPVPDPGVENYVAYSSGLAVAGAGCSFPTPALYAIRTSPPSVLRVDLVTGSSSTLAPIAGVDTLNGIAFDRSGRFGNRLLVIGPHSGQTVVDAVDCNGRVSLVTDSAPRMEGGMEVAPPTFGAFGGDLIAPDEYSGALLAVTPEGTTQIVTHNNLPSGGDIGAESAGFVPPGFSKGGAAYLADRATANNAHVGTDTLLRLTADQLLAAGVAEGDLLVANEGAGTTVAIRCAADGSCTEVLRIGQASDAAHIEGHLLLVATTPAPSPSPL